RFKATLALAPGDKQVTAHLQELEAKLKKASAPAPAAAAPAARGAEEAPIPLVAAEEDFELERPYEAPVSPPPPAEPPAPPHATSPPHPAGGFESSGPAAEFEFDLAPDAGGGATVPEPWHPEPSMTPLPPAPPAPTVSMREPFPEPEAEPPIPPPPRIPA